MKTLNAYIIEAIINKDLTGEDICNQISYNKDIVDNLYDTKVEIAPGIKCFISKTKLSNLDIWARTDQLIRYQLFDVIFDIINSIKESDDIDITAIDIWFGDTAKEIGFTLYKESKYFDVWTTIKPDSNIANNIFYDTSSNRIGKLQRLKKQIADSFK